MTSIDASAPTPILKQQPASSSNDDTQSRINALQKQIDERLKEVKQLNEQNEKSGDDPEIKKRIDATIKMIELLRLQIEFIRAAEAKKMKTIDNKIKVILLSTTTRSLLVHISIPKCDTSPCHVVLDENKKP